MPYNITHCEYIGDGRLRINRMVAAGLRKHMHGKLPEIHFLEQDNLKGDGEATIEAPLWCGESSGTSYDKDYILEALSHTQGTATIAFFWEGGDTRTALCVTDGEVVEKACNLVVADLEDDEEGAEH